MPLHLVTSNLTLTSRSRSPVHVHVNIFFGGGRRSKKETKHFQHDKISFISNTPMLECWQEYIHVFTYPYIYRPFILQVTIYIMIILSFKIICNTICRTTQSVMAPFIQKKKEGYIWRVLQKKGFCMVIEGLNAGYLKTERRVLHLNGRKGDWMVKIKEIRQMKGLCRVFTWFWTIHFWCGIIVIWHTIPNWPQIFIRFAVLQINTILIYTTLRLL